ncbi:MAG: archease [Patescibacteria group bacterium]|nr:archease [Patescibacteria group bacterium]
MYKILPHTADVRILVSSLKVEGLFKEALKGLAEILSPFWKERKRKKILGKIKISSLNETTLLIDFLSEVLLNSYAKKAVFKKVDFKEFRNNFLEAEIEGWLVDGFRKDIKAITYHEAKISRDKKGRFETVIVCDI